MLGCGAFVRATPTSVGQRHSILMSLSSAHLIDGIDVQNALGEGVLGRHSDSTVWRVEALGRQIHCLDWPSVMQEL